jgi:hypothetical protein
MVSYKDGNPIPQVTDPTQRESPTKGAWAYYNNDSKNQDFIIGML